MKSEENMDLLELTFRHRGIKRDRPDGPGCPKCGEKNVLRYPNGRAIYACGYSQGHIGKDTPCTNLNKHSIVNG